jgi:hypothetical protein
MGSTLDTTGGIEGSSLSSINNKLIFVVVMETSSIVKKKLSVIVTTLLFLHDSQWLKDHVFRFDLL